MEEQRELTKKEIEWYENLGKKLNWECFTIDNFDNWVHYDDSIDYYTIFSKKSLGKENNFFVSEDFKKEVLELAGKIKAFNFEEIKKKAKNEIELLNLEEVNIWFNEFKKRKDFLEQLILEIIGYKTKESYKITKSLLEGDWIVTLSFNDFNSRTERLNAREVFDFLEKENFSFIETIKLKKIKDLFYEQIKNTQEIKGYETKYLILKEKEKKWELERNTLSKNIVGKKKLIKDYINDFLNNFPGVEVLTENEFLSKIDVLIDKC